LKLIVGLGNPGKQYSRNRHNVGFMCLDLLAARHGLTFNQRRFKASVAEWHRGEKVALAKPQTFMNLSGEAVRSLMGWYHWTPADVLVVYDDLDLPLGTLRIREGGSSGGHRGMQSIVDWLKTQEFPRLRIGIGRPAVQEVKGYVLADFHADEKPVVEETIARAADAVETILAEGIVSAMNKFNRT
jgi:peptidyl-tRNA hydrolase, PTH1 family